MVSRKAVDEFLSGRRIAVAGVSRDTKGFGNMVFRELKARGYQPIPVNPNATTLEGERCYPSVGSLPTPVDGVILMLPPDAAIQVVKEAQAAGVRRVWFHPRAVSPEGVKLARESGMLVVEGACPFMFLAPVGFIHRCHRFVTNLSGAIEA